MKRNQKGSSNIFIAIAVIVVLAVAGFYLLRGKTATSPTATGTVTNQAIQSDSGLQQASQDLDNTNVDGAVDAGLNQNTTDAQTF